MKPIEFVSATTSDLDNLIKLIRVYLIPGTLFLIDGSMGAGKTFFVSRVVECLGGTHASSPTFTFHQSYNLKNGALEHLDLYRIKNENEVESIGLWDLLHVPNKIVMIEWAERVNKNLWPKNWRILTMHIDFIDSEKRKYLLTEL